LNNPNIKCISHIQLRKEIAFFIRQSLGMTVKCSRIENFLVCTSPSSISKDKEGTGLRETSPFWSLNYMQEIFPSFLMGLINMGGGQSDEEYFNMKHLLLLILKFREIRIKV